jgi:hypothetical protein
MVCLLLLAILFWPKTGFNADSKPVVAPPSVIQTESEGRLLLEADYVALVQKPLFNPSRMAAVSSVSVMTEKVISATPLRAEPTPVSLPNLLGVMQVDGVDIAFVIGNDDIESTGLRVGDSYQGWELTSISGTEIVLRKNGTDETISLDWGTSGEALVMNGHLAEIETETKAMTAEMVNRPTTHRIRDRLAKQIKRDELASD